MTKQEAISIVKLAIATNESMISEDETDFDMFLKMQNDAFKTLLKEVVDDVKQ